MERGDWPCPLAPWAERAEEAYIARALGKAAPPPLPVPPSWPAAARAAASAAVACAVAARYLAVGKPRSLGIVTDDPARATVLALAHEVWHRPADVRWAVPSADELIAWRGGRAVAVADALTADVVCVDAAMTLELGQVRRGSHLALLRAEASPELLARAVCVAEQAGDGRSSIGELAAGLRDGRQLDEITLLLLAGPRGVAVAASALGLG